MNRPSIAGLRSHLGRAALACVVAGIACMPVAHARTRDGTVVVPPSGLPEAARHAGESLLLVNSYDDRTLLYVEQDGGRTLTVLDVTDPGHVTVSSSLALEAPAHSSSFPCSAPEPRWCASACRVTRPSWTSPATVRHN